MYQLTVDSNLNGRFCRQVKKLGANGGEGGIRTRVGRKPLLDFESSPLWPLRYLSRGGTKILPSLSIHNYFMLYWSVINRWNIKLMYRRRYAAAVGGLLLLQLLSGATASQNELQQVLDAGELVVVTRNAPTTYYQGPDGAAGIEYELAKGFAESLGVKLRLVVAANVSDVLRRLADGGGNLAAAGLTITPARERWLRFTPAYQQVTQQLVYRTGEVVPTSMSTLNGTLEVLANSSHAERLTLLKTRYPQLSWQENGRLNSEELLSQVFNGELDYTIADSNEVAVERRFYPDLRVAFNVSSPESLGWAFSRSRDGSLYQAAVRYFEQLKSSGRLAQMVEGYYGHVEDFDYGGARAFFHDSDQRLGLYRANFESAAADNHIDWRLLAAMAYQESHWDPRAISPTGVRGIMMLTQDTARDLGVDQRTDAAQSIDGGARYFKYLLDNLPETIQGRDRIWLALAAYNIGLGHLEDARVITQKRGGDPNRWVDVKANLPLLQHRKWYARAHYGYARGDEAVRYVENIRSYYDILAWALDRETPEIQQISTPVAVVAEN